LTKPVGSVNFDISGAREVATNDVSINVADESAGAKVNGGGYLTKDTTPIFERVNAATDPALRIRWAASNSEEIMLPPMVLPADVDQTAAVTIKIAASIVKAGGAVVDNPVIAVKVFQGIGDSDAGGNTDAVTANGTLQVVTKAVTAGDLVSSLPVSLSLTPGAHTTDALVIYGVWLEYSRKTWPITAITSTTKGQVWSLADLAKNDDNEVSFLAVLRDNLY
jgi:hypothetical protein